MSYKTDRLTALFPDAYSAAESSSLLFKLLDAIGAELMQADDGVKRLLKSHWLPYASGPALDSLGALLGAERRMLHADASGEGALEHDASFRRYLGDLVRQYTGGGTVEAIKGAVRSALGMPFDLDDLGLPPEHAPLRQAIEELVTLREFSSLSEQRSGSSATSPRGASGVREVSLVFEDPSVGVETIYPEIEWSFTSGAARRVRVDCAGQGFESIPGALFPAAGAPLLLTARADGSLRAFLGVTEVTGSFRPLGGAGAPKMPAFPTGRSLWRFSSPSGLLDASAFDQDNAFDPPDFTVKLSRVRREPLTFEVEVPLGLPAKVEALRIRHGYRGKLLVYRSLPLDQIQRVVDRHSAAGVSGRLRYVLHLQEKHDASESARLHLRHRVREEAGARESLTVGSEEKRTDSHDARERFAFWRGGRFELSTFDAGFAFQ